MKNPDKFRQSVANRVRAWLHAHTPLQRKRMAERAKTSVGYLYQLALTSRGDRGYRGCQPELAARIEKATRGELRREDLSATCRECPMVRAGVKR